MSVNKVSDNKSADIKNGGSDDSGPPFLFSDDRKRGLLKKCIFALSFLSKIAKEEI
jgi:hypothetical protein